MKLKLTAGFLAVLALSATAHASSASAVIEDLTIDTGTNFARIRVGTATVTGRPACHNAAYTSHYSFDVSTAKGRALLTAVTSALLSGRSVGVVGTNACLNVGPGSIEEIASLTIWK